MPKASESRLICPRTACNPMATRMSAIPHPTTAKRDCLRRRFWSADSRPSLPYHKAIEVCDKAAKAESKLEIAAANAPARMSPLKPGGITVVIHTGKTESVSLAKSAASPGVGGRCW